MPQYRLTYFPVRVKAEVSRLLFAVADQEYEDVRVDDDELPVAKKVAPFGQLPTLEVDGKFICQSKVIIRFLARRFGLSPTDEWGQTRAEEILDCMDDIWERLYIQIYEEGDFKRKKELTVAYMADTFPLQFGGLEKMLLEKEGGDAYFLGKQMTYADLAFFSYHEYVTILLGEAIPWDKYPKLQALVQRVASHPKVAAWVARRPQTDM